MAPGVHDGVHEGVHDGVHDDVTATARRILACCSEAASTPELLTALGYTSRTRNFREGLSSLLEAGLLEMTIPSAPRSKNQRYRLTDKGQAYLGSLESR